MFYDDTPLYENHILAEIKLTLYQGDWESLCRHDNYLRVLELLDLTIKTQVQKTRNRIRYTKTTFEETRLSMEDYAMLNTLAEAFRKGSDDAVHLRVKNVTMQFMPI